MMELESRRETNSTPRNSFSMKILNWNCRGVLNPRFIRTFNNLMDAHTPDVVILSETRLDGDRAHNVISKLPFDNWHTTETLGFAGGLWLLWRTDLVEVQILNSTEQEIHALVRPLSSNSFWLLSAVYASPRIAERRWLWDNLKTVADANVLPWVILGDFNDVIHGREKLGGNQVNLRRALDFKRCMDYCNMIDLGFVGPRFTWTNKRDLSNLIQERLDRAWANPTWRSLFPEAFVSHLTRTHSDHCPLLLSLDLPAQDFRPRPFRFEKMWLSHPSFPTVVHNAWEEFENVYTRAAILFTDRVTAWNRDTFGNLFHRKKRVLARLSGAQKALASNPTPFLWNLERDLLAEYNSILDQEQEFWALKSRVNWLIDGDRNNKFFHISTLVRRRRNKILSLKDGSGCWCSQAHEVEDMVQLFFKNLFQTSHSSSLEAQDFLPTTIINISSTDSDALSSPISDDEIKSALFSMKPFKAPGPDGFHAGFYQRCWSTVGESVINVIKNIFSSVSFPAGFNNTLIALVPKCVGPESLTQYRPISLCNSIYKTITKILVCRLRSILPSIVSPIQTAFVPGRQGMDNVVIVQEIVHALSRRKGRVGGMAIKIDLEKAYDRMEWSFIKVVLEHFKFPTSFVNLVMECISSSSVAILLNGAPLDSFSPSRGLRQGDPLSSYIFILCMEFLGFHIMESCAVGEWHPIKAGQSGPKFSHLFFADDLVLFSSATISCAHAIDEVLGKFCHSSGQKVSASKSRVLFSANVNPSLRSNIEQILNLKETTDLGKYLGIPISSSAVRAKDFDYLIEKVALKLSGWKARLLTLPGRAILIQSVSKAIPAYVMQCTPLPAKVCDNLDALNRNFLWGSTADKGKLHLVNWQKVTQPKRFGGLGLHSAKVRNTVSMAKLVWRASKDETGLWATVIRHKYLKKLSANGSKKSLGSRIWSGIKKGWPLFSRGSCWAISNGLTTSAWHDKWVGGVTLRSLLIGPLNFTEDSLMVSDILLGNGLVDLSRISFVLPSQLTDSLKAIPLQCWSNSQDTRYWLDSPTGEFNFKSAYQLESNSCGQPSHFAGGK